MGQDKEYYAFISYKREDEKWAKWLQHKLEHYKLPSNLNGRTDLPREIRLVFSDTSELNPGNLPQQIHDALAASKHLIVICSPRSAQSVWVNKEIETFIAMGKQDCIIPFIIDGRPYADDSSEECFPSAIRNLPKEQELLGANITEMGRDAAAVKTVAQMFGVRFDTLWKRYEREQRRKRVLSIMAVALFVLAVLWVAGWIGRQNVIITKSRNELQSAYDNLNIANRATEREKNRAVQAEHNLSNANDSIQTQNIKIIDQRDSISLINENLKKTNWKILKDQSVFVAGKASEIIKENSLLAQKLALAILPRNIVSPNRPYTPHAERLLRMSTKYKSGYINPYGECKYFYADFSPNGQSVIAVPVEKKEAHVFSLDSGSLQQIIPLSFYPSHFVFSRDGKCVAFALVNGDVYIYHKKNGKWVAYQKCSNICNSITKHGGETNYLSFSNDNVYLSSCKGNSILILKCISGNWVNVDTIKGHSKTVRMGKFDKTKNNEFISASDDGAIKIWRQTHPDYWYCVDSIKIKGIIESVEFGFKNKKIIASDSDGHVFVWERVGRAWQCMDTILQYSPQGHLLYAYRTSFRPNYDDEIAVSFWSSNMQCVLFMAKQFNTDATGRIMNDGKTKWNTIASIPGNCQCVNWDKSGEMILSTLNGIWITPVSSPIPKGRTIKLTNDFLPEKLIEKGYSVLSPDGNYRLTIESGENKHKQIWVWNRPYNECVDILEVWNDGMYTNAFFSPDGKEIVSIQAGKRVRIWDFPSLQQLIDETRERLKNNPLTQEERRRYYLE